ncbi:amidase [Pseudonocardia acaciae]|uniref:amidase n=1 Tax=Pseudonocardia acaciae TaxID=551276 RepID=UPI0006888EDC|nr:amidase family protein [Pseudonocardia acaciae]
MSATELAAAIRARELSPVEATEAVLDRIAALDPELNAFCTVTAETARHRAREAERQVLRGDPLGPLHGVPYSLKDLTPTKGIRTTFGSRLTEHHVPTEDALVARRMAESGGVLVGKTNTPEGGCKAVTDNPVFGPTRNPWHTGRTPGGSSGGAAAAVAAGMAPLAEGSDFAGSIRIPAAFCGLVGFKPSDGRIPTAPNPMLWHPITYCNGPITRSVADAALMLQVLAGPDDADPRSLPDTGEDFPSVVAAERPVTGWRVGWLGNLGFVPVEAEVTRACRRALGVLGELGCELEDVEPANADFSAAVEAYVLLNANRRAALMEPHLPERERDVDPLMIWRVEHSRARTATDAARAEMVQSAVYQRVRRLFERYDLLALPTTPCPPFEIGVDYPAEIAGVPLASQFDLIPLTYLFNMTGHPAVSLPAGPTEDGLPVGLQLVGRWRGDADLLRAAGAYERAAPWADRWPPLVPASGVRA